MIKHVQIILKVLLFLTFFGFIFLGYLVPWSWTGFIDFVSPNGDFSRGKTLWDWLELVLIPAVLAFSIYFLNRSERHSEKEIIAEKVREDALQAYFNHVSDFLRNYKWDELENDETLKNILRARTLTVLRILDGDRKALLLRFLYQTKLIEKNRVVIDLSGADLSYANLSGSDEGGNRDRTFMSYLSLSEAVLFGVNLSNANLREAKLNGAILRMADLTNADLSDADLIKADLRCTTLIDVNLSNTNFIEANLSGATGLNEKQLSSVRTLKGATGPNNEIY